MNSDQRRPVHFGAGTYGSSGDEGSSSSRTIWMDLRWRPTNALTVTLSPNLSRNRPEMQYVDTVSFAGGERYLFGRLDQETKALTVRLDFALKLPGIGRLGPA